MDRTTSNANLSPGLLALNQVMSYYKYEMTDFEGLAWAQLVSEFGDEALRQFLFKHMECSEFAPRISEAIKVIDPARNNTSLAFEELIRAVKLVGPYVSPTFNDPVLPGTVVLLGGWVVVNQELPGEVGSFEFTAYRKRFDALYAQARAELVFHQAAAPKLRALHDLSKPVALLGHAVSSDAAHTQERPRP